MKMCFNETYSKVRISKYLADRPMFPVQNYLKLADALLTLLFSLL
jgi:hypothetical protein